MTNDEKPTADLNKLFDLDRKQLTRQMVDNIEQCMRDVQSAQEDLRQIIAGGKEAGFSPRDLSAMKTIARLRLKDEGGVAREKLEALERIGQAVGFDLFDWAAVRNQQRPEAA